MSRRALSASRAIDVLEFLAAHPRQTFSYSELSRALEVNLASMHSILTALCESAMLTRSDEDRTYSLGPALVALGDAALRQNPEIDELRGCMRALSHGLGREILAYMRVGGEALCISRTGPEQARGSTVDVGHRIPMAAPFFSLFFAWAADVEIDRWLARSNLRADEQRRQRSVLELVRRRGYSVLLERDATFKVEAILAKMADHPRSAEFVRELRSTIKEVGEGGEAQLFEGRPTPETILSINVPVFGAQGQVELALTVNVFEKRVSWTEIETIAARVTAATRTIFSGSLPRSLRSDFDPPRVSGSHSA